MKTVTIIPPRILEYFDAKLLSRPYPSMRETSQHLNYVYLYLKKLFHKKTKSGKIPAKKAKCEKDLLEFERVMCEILQKEKELEGKTDHPTQRPFYFIGNTTRKGDEIFRRAKWKGMSLSFSNEYRKGL